MWTAEGAVLIDPAAHGGHRETDLAMLALFGCPFSTRCSADISRCRRLRTAGGTGSGCTSCTRCWPTWCCSAAATRARRRRPRVARWRWTAVMSLCDSRLTTTDAERATSRHSARSASSASSGPSSCAYSVVTWLSSRYTRVLPTMTGQRSAVQNSSDSSAYWPPPAARRRGLGRDTGVVQGDRARGRAFHRIVHMRGHTRRHRRVRIRNRAEHQNACARASQPLHQPGQAVQPRLVIGTKPKSAPYRRDMSSTISRAAPSPAARGSPRHCSHSVNFRPRYGLLIGRSCNGHSTLLIVSNRQCRSCAIGSSAGCHIAACESRPAPPSSATRHHPTRTRAARHPATTARIR